MGETQTLVQIPTSLYVLVGGLVLANFGTVITVIYGIGKVVWFIAKLESRVEALEKDYGRDMELTRASLRDINKIIVR